MRHFTELIFQCLYILHLHILNHDHGECTHAVFIHHNVLAFHRLQMLRKVT